MYARGAALLCCVLLLTPGSGEGKVIAGVASSLEAWRQKGQFITKFCFHGKLQSVYLKAFSRSVL